MNKEEYQRMESEHLSILTSYGRNYTSSVADAAGLLEREYLGESKLSAEEKKELFKLLVDAARKHMELIQWSLKERQMYVDSAPGENNSELSSG